MPELESIEDFAILILVHMATVDGSLHPTEMDTIADRIQKLFPQISNVKEKMFQISESIVRKGKEFSEKVIEDGAAKLNVLTTDQKKELYVMLFDIINADGRVNQEETRTLRLLKTHLA